MEQIVNTLKKVNLMKTSSSSRTSSPNLPTPPTKPKLKARKSKSVGNSRSASNSRSSRNSRSKVDNLSSEEGGEEEEGRGIGGQVEMSKSESFKSTRRKRKTTDESSSSSQDFVYKFQFKAKNLPIADTLTRSSDPYFILKYNGKDVKKSVAIEKTLAPKWKPFHLKSSKFGRKNRALEDDEEDEDINLQ